MDPDRTPAIPRGALAGVANRVSEMEQLLEAFERARAAARVERLPRPYDGDPVALTKAVGSNIGQGRAMLAVSDTGVMAYRTGNGAQLRQLRWRDRAGRLLGAVGQPDAMG